MSLSGEKATFALAYEMMPWDLDGNVLSEDVIGRRLQRGKLSCMGIVCA